MHVLRGTIACLRVVSRVCVSIAAAPAVRGDTQTSKAESWTKRSGWVEEEGRRGRREPGRALLTRALQETVRGGGYTAASSVRARRGKQRVTKQIRERKEKTSEKALRRRGQLWHGGTRRWAMLGGGGGLGGREGVPPMTSSVQGSSREQSKGKVTYTHNTKETTQNKHTHTRPTAHQQRSSESAKYKNVEVDHGRQRAQIDNAQTGGGLGDTRSRFERDTRVIFHHSCVRTGEAGGHAIEEEQRRGERPKSQLANTHMPSSGRARRHATLPFASQLRRRQAALPHRR